MQGLLSQVKDLNQTGDMGKRVLSFSACDRRKRTGEWPGEEKFKVHSLKLK